MLNMKLNVANVLDIMTTTFTRNSLLVASLNLLVQAIHHVIFTADLLLKG